MNKTGENFVNIDSSVKEKDLSDKLEEESVQLPQSSAKKSEEPRASQLKKRKTAASVRSRKSMNSQI